MAEKTKMTSDEFRELREIVGRLMGIESSYVFASVMYDALMKKVDERADIIESKVNLLLKQANILLDDINESDKIKKILEEDARNGNIFLVPNTDPSVEYTYAGNKEVLKVSLPEPVGSVEELIPAMTQAFYEAMRRRSSEKQSKTGKNLKATDEEIYDAWEKNCYKVNDRLVLKLGVTKQHIYNRLKEMPGAPFYNRKKLVEELKQDMSVRQE